MSVGSAWWPSWWARLAAAKERKGSVGRMGGCGAVGVEPLAVGVTLVMVWGW